jgi:plasmid maintenance system killer protein
MEFSFADKELEKLYTEGRSRKYRLPNNLVKKYIMRVNGIKAAETIHDFWHDPALNFERLQGHDNIFSMRINIKWRLILSIDFQDKEKTYGIVSIEEVNNHYE